MDVTRDSIQMQVVIKLTSKKYLVRSLITYTNPEEYEPHFSTIKDLLENGEYTAELITPYLTNDSMPTLIITEKG